MNNQKKSSELNISYENAKQNLINAISVNRLGEPDELGSLATWLLSPISGFITGQTVSVDGGAIKFNLG
ncbi:MAG: SDR family oxidoreductase [bacterium]